MPSELQLLLVLHNHQPVDNFDDVVDEAFQQSYLPFLDVFQDYGQLRLAMHISGPLMEWLDRQQPRYVDRLADLVAEGRLEMVGGAFCEPILTMIPARDRVGQIIAYRRWLGDRLGADVQGLWMPERVWEQPLASNLADAGVAYTILDDFHFKCAGLGPDDLYGYYLTEDEGKTVKVFPGSERLRYLIPFASPEETIDYLREVAERRPGSILMFADDGEKLGVWPGTHQHVYRDGWLRRFFDLLLANQSWLSVSTPAQVIEQVPPLGKVYLPEGSYREMTEWALPASELTRFEDLRQQLEQQEIWPAIASFVRGGFWRNFKRKYPESDEMYTRMMMVSQRVEQAARAGEKADLVDEARRELYRGQCNCGYWHGAFGGIYLPHLRGAIYRHLIAADNLLEAVAGRPVCCPDAGWVDADSGDFNLDDRPEVRLASDRFLALLAPSAGGQLYELDVRAVCHNLLATLARRPEAYHRKIIAGSGHGASNVTSIHDMVVCKQEGLDKKIQYDAHPRKSLLDHFFDPDTDLAAVAGGIACERGDFLSGAFASRIRRSPDRVQVVLTRTGNVNGHPVKLTKGLTLQAGQSTIQIAYLLENLPLGEALHLAVELNFAGLPAAADGRFFHDGAGRLLGDLGASLALQDTRAIGLTDEWIGINLALSIDRPSGIWTFPIRSVNQSEGGFELVHQSIAILPHWQIPADHAGRFQVTMTLDVDTTMAESRTRETEAVTS